MSIFRKNSVDPVSILSVEDLQSFINLETLIKQMRHHILNWFLVYTRTQKPFDTSGKPVAPQEVLTGTDKTGFFEWVIDPLWSATFLPETNPETGFVPIHLNRIGTHVRTVMLPLTYVFKYQTSTGELLSKSQIDAAHYLILQAGKVAEHFTDSHIADPAHYDDAEFCYKTAMDSLLAPGHEEMGDVRQKTHAAARVLGLR